MSGTSGAQSAASGADELVGRHLADARRRGFLGPGPIVRHIEHSHAFSSVLSGLLDPCKRRVADLGSGAGIPGLIVALDMPSAEVSLIEAGLGRVEALRSTIRACGLAGRVDVVHGRAETVGRDERYRGTFDAVVARSFSRPAVTAECAAPLLRSGGLLVVSEPPKPAGHGEGPSNRWAAERLGELGLEVHAEVEFPVHLIVLRQVRLCSERFPRRVGVPAKRPLF
jgi:16S rRNA (guanine527-N7)-methyltransferase